MKNDMRFRICLIAVAVLGTAIIVPATGLGQTPTAGLAPLIAAPEPVPPSNALNALDHYVVRGGWVTHFLLIPLSIVAMALYVEYAFTIRRAMISPPETARHLGELLESRQYAEALRVAEEDRSVLGYVIYCGLGEADRGLPAVERAMEDALEERAAKLARKIDYLNLIGAVSPMLGLLGTVHGIIGMFISISDAGGIPVMSRISYDLGSALVATFWGLLVAIPALSVFAILRNRIDVLLGECALAAARLVAQLKPRGAVGTSSAPRAAATASV